MSDEGSTVTKKKSKYLELTAEARGKASPIAESEEDVARLDSMMRMCDDYQADAKHFLEGRFGSSLWSDQLRTCLIDAAVRIGLMDGHGDDRLFTLP